MNTPDFWKYLWKVMSLTRTRYLWSTTCLESCFPQRSLVASPKKMRFSLAAWLVDQQSSLNRYSYFAIRKCCRIEGVRFEVRFVLRPSNCMVHRIVHHFPYFLPKKASFLSVTSFLHWKNTWVYRARSLRCSRAEQADLLKRDLSRFYWIPFT